MTNTDEGLGRAAESANRLYWSSDASVNEVAEELGLSKGGLYELLRPFPSGAACPECGSELGYANRTARDRDRKSCSDCGFEADGMQELEPAESPASPPGSRRPPLTDEERKEVRNLAGGVLIGLAAGLLLGSMLRR